MLYRYLIRNYYEINGTFKDIQLTNIGPVLLRASADSNKSIEDICYNILGYVGDKDHSIADVIEIRKNAILGKYDGFSTKKQFLTWIKTLYPDYVVPKSSLIRKNVIDSDIFKVCYVYYRDCFHGYVDFTEGKLSMFEHSEFLRTNAKAAEEAFNSIKRNNDSLKVVKSDDGKLYITNNTLFVPESIKVDDIDKITHDAFMCALFGLKVDLSSLASSYNMFGFLSIVKPNVYLLLMDLSHALGITYKELMTEVNINVPDQIKAFNRYGFALIGVDNEGFATVIDNSSTEQEPFVRRIL